MPHHRSGQEHRCRADERCVDDLEIVVVELEHRFGRRVQDSKPLSLNGLRLVVWRIVPLLPVCADSGDQQSGRRLCSNEG